MSEKHTKLLTAIGMAGAIPDTYRSKDGSKKCEKALIVIDQRVTAAIRFFGRVGAENLKIIGDRIDKANADSAIMGKARSIITYVDYAIWMLESCINDGSARIRGIQGIVYIRYIVGALLKFREEVSGGRDWQICSIAGIKAAERFREL